MNAFYENDDAPGDDGGKPRWGVTALLAAISAGETGARSRLYPLVEAELRGIARRRMSRLRPGFTLTTTDLANDAYLRLVEAEAPWKSRREFYIAASRVMRNSLVDAARRRRRRKRGGDWTRVRFSEEVSAPPPRHLDLLALDEALERLERFDEQQHEIVMLKYFCGLDTAEVAGAMRLSVRTVARHWQFARAWLSRELA
jgi:RNA polymerase sigma factor (TIGR02999 family)